MKLVVKESKLRILVRQCIAKMCYRMGNMDESFSKNPSDYYTQDQLDRFNRLKSKGQRLNAAYKEK